MTGSDLVVRGVAIVAVCGAIAAIVVSKVAQAFACEEREPCSSVSAPNATVVVAWIGLAGAIALVPMAWRAPHWAWVILASLIVNYLLWLSLFVYVVQGDL